MTIKHTIHPNFFIGLASYLLFLAGVFARYGNISLGTTIIATAIALGAIHWIAAIIDVSTNKALKKDGRSWYLWIALIIMVPPLSGMLYYMMKKRKVNF